MKEAKLRIPIKQDHSKPITADKLRALPSELEEAETPEKSISKLEHASLSTPLPELISISDAVRKTNLSYEYLRYLCYSKKVNNIRCGRKYMIDTESLAEFIKRGGEE